MIRRNFYTVVCALALSLPCFAQNVEEDTGDNDVSVRENPTIDGVDDDFDFNVPSFIKETANHIIFNGANWNSLRVRLKNSHFVPFSIVHIGDSHLQADHATGAIRDYLQYDYGNAGRGLVTPLRMSGSNQPADYSFKSDNKWSSVKLMGQSWSRTMGFTGTSISPANTSSNIIVSTSEKDDYDPFSSITVFHNGQFFVTSVTDADGQRIPFVATPSKDYTHISLTSGVTSACINFDSAGDLTVFGASLSGNRPGLFYHVIGNNGAAFDTYNRIGHVGDGIEPLHPDLVIISLGTNEAFGRLNTSAFTKSVNRLVDNIKRNNPSATILLVTPMECQRSVYTTVQKKGRKRKGRRRTTRVRSYKANSNILPLRNAILEYGKENNVAVYDWYTVAGGADASTKWIADGLFSHDRVHHSVKGYQLQGFLLYQALKDAFENK